MIARRYVCVYHDKVPDKLRNTIPRDEAVIGNLRVRARQKQYSSCCEVYIFTQQDGKKVLMLSIVGLRQRDVEKYIQEQGKRLQLNNGLWNAGEIEKAGDLERTIARGLKNRHL